MKKLPAVLIFAIVASSCYLAVILLRWQLVAILTVFLEPFVELGATGLLLAALLWSLVVLIRRWWQHKVDLQVVSALVLCLGALSIYFFVPIDRLMIEADFRIHLQRRTQIASEIVAGKWEGKVIQRGGRGESIDLSGADQHLSDGGEVLFWQEGKQDVVLIMTFRGVLDSFSGFVYSSNDQPPPHDAFLGNPVEVERLGPHWYWYASRN